MKRLVLNASPGSFRRIQAGVKTTLVEFASDFEGGRPEAGDSVTLREFIPPRNCPSCDGFGNVFGADHDADLVVDCPNCLAFVDHAGGRAGLEPGTDRLTGAECRVLVSDVVRPGALGIPEQLVVCSVRVAGTLKPARPKPPRTGKKGRKPNRKRRR